MTGIADKIIQGVFGRDSGSRMWMPMNSLDLGSREAVGQALSYLAKTGQLRPVGHGLDDVTRIGSSPDTTMVWAQALSVRSSYDLALRGRTISQTGGPARVRAGRLEHSPKSLAALGPMVEFGRTGRRALLAPGNPMLGGQDSPGPAIGLHSQ